MAHWDELLRMITIFVLVCPHLAWHPVLQRLEGEAALRQCLGQAVLREVAVLMAEHNMAEFRLPPPQQPVPQGEAATQPPMHR